MKRQRVKFPGTSTEKTKHYKLKRSTLSSIGGRLSPTSGIVNLAFSCQNGFLSASICSLIIKALVITESAVPSLLRPGFETVPLQKSCTTNSYCTVLLRPAPKHFSHHIFHISMHLKN